MTAPEKSDVETVRKEAQTLRALLESVIPEYRTGRSDVSLGANTPDAVRAFWEVIGFSTVFRPFVNAPDEESGRKEAVQILKGWEDRANKAGLGEKLRRLLQAREKPMRADQLPRRFRFVGVSDRWDAFYITDESTGASDPPVLAVTRDPPAIRRAHPSYLRRTVTGLLQKLFNLNGADARFRPPLTGTQPLPTLAPHLMQLADGIWRLTTPHDRDETSARAGDVDKLGYAHWDRLVEFCYGVEGSEMAEFYTTNGSFLPLKTEMKKVVLAKSKLREFKYPREGREQVELVGWVEGIAAWITLDLATQEMTGLSVSPENRERLLAWIDQNIGSAMDDDDDHAPHDRPAAE